MGESILHVEHLDVHYGGIHALKGITLCVDEGQIVTLIGANGAGKTTTLRAISGLVKVSGGTIRFRGDTELTELEPQEIVELGISHVPEGRRIFANMTVWENLQLGAYLRHKDKAGIARDLEHMVELFPILGERKSQLGGTLSGGEQQMLAIARALMSRPRLLILDEPSLGLAPLIVEDIFETIVRLNAEEGVSVLLVEQNAAMALKVGEKGYVLETGAITLEGTCKKLAASDEVKEAYLGG